MTAVPGYFGDRQVADDHGAVFHLSDEQRAVALHRYVADGLRSGAAVVVVVTEAHCRQLEQRLDDEGIDVAGCRADGQYVFVDAVDLLGRLRAGGSIDARVFHDVVGGLVRRAHATARPVLAYGEMVGLLWDEGQVGEAVALELLWCELREQVPFELLCAYASTSVVDDDHLAAFNDVCSLHGRTLGPTARWEADAGRVCAFPLAAESPRQARRFVVDVLGDVDDRDAVDEAVLIVSELAGNAVSHARTGFVVAVEHDERTIRVTVTDGSPTRPAPRQARSFDESGRGLALVAGLATRWGAEACAGGKAVWAEIATAR